MRAPPSALLVSLLVFLALAACAPKRPVLYPNEQLREVGDEVAQRDIDACLELAAQEGYERPGATEQTAHGAARGSIGGAVIGSLIGWVFGNPGRGAAAGAAGGGAKGGMKGAARSGDPDPIQRGFVEQCLRERGYEPIGWR